MTCCIRCGGPGTRHKEGCELSAEACERRFWDAREQCNSAIRSWIDNNRTEAMNENATRFDTEKWDPACIARHIGMWLAEPLWLAAAAESIKARTYPVVEAREPGERPTLFQLDTDGIAVIRINGAIMKADSKHGGTNSLRTRRAIREAVRDVDVKGILLHVDSPGGTVAGTAELANEVQQADKHKPVFAQIDDLGASAAYWVASQARRISANATAEVGSIGTVAVVEDSSGAAEAEGIKVHVISTGEFKGAFVQGAPVTAAHLAHLQERVNDLNKHFLAGVKRGRGMAAADVRSVADGRVFSAATARELNLIDAVQSLEETHRQLVREVRPAKRERAALMVDLAEAE